MESFNADLDADFIFEYPCVVANKNNTYFTGFIFINDNTFTINLAKKKSYFQLQITESMKMLNLEADIKKLNLEDFTHPVQYLNSLKSLLTTQLQAKRPRIHTMVPVELYQKILLEFQEFQNFYIYLDSCKLSADLSSINVVYCDDKRREHVATISTMNESLDKVCFTLKNLDLPIEEDLIISDLSLVNVYQSFCELVQSFQAFMDLMDYIDSHCWILDPDKPLLRRHTYRRIALDGQLSIIIDVHPKYPFDLPKVRALGAKNQSEILYEKIHSNYDQWDSSGDFIEELCKLIGIENFPNKSSFCHDGLAEDLVKVGECSICFSRRNDASDELPEITCANESCMLTFHNDCLFQWLKTLSTSYVMLQKMFGNCPNCTKSICCDIPR